MFLRRLDQATVSPANLCAGGHSCPAILELDSGDFAIIGADITELSAGNLPPGSGCGPDERVIRIPRQTLLRARMNIPEV